MIELAPPLVALVAAAALCRLFAPIARRIGLVDHPGGRKRHEQATPLVGGIAIAVAAALGVLLATTPVGEHRTLFAGVLILLVTGVLDDFHELSTRARFASQIAAACVMGVLADIVLRDFGALLGPATPGLGPLALPVTVFCVVGVINAVNMVDGLDGLAGATVASSLGGLLLLGARAGDGPGTLVVAVLLGAVLGFLMMNARWRAQGKARVFLGDAGSMVLGFALAWLLVRHSQGANAWFAPVTALWLLAVPVIDTVFVIGHRLARGESPFSGGRDHLHHLFVRAGFSVRQTTALHALLSLACAGAGLLLELLGTPEPLRFAAFLVLSACYAFFIGRAWQRGQWLGRKVLDG